MKENKISTIQQVYNQKDNFFDLLRFVLAIAVIFSHSFILLKGQSNGEDPLTSISNNQISMGTLAVNCFFVVSGFLIMQSLTSNSSYIKYFLNRFLRIFPAFFTSLFLVSIIIGPLISSFSIKDYFAINNSGPLEFIFKNMSFNIFGYSWTVRDAFVNNPFPGSANGSMWTLKHEFALYLILPLLNYFLIVKFRKLFLIMTFVLTLLSIVNILYDYKLLNLVGDYYWVLSINEYTNFIRLAPYFMIGSLLYLYRDRVVISHRLIILCLILIIVGFKAGLLNIVLMFTIPYILIAVSVSIKFSVFRKYGDFSYGMYIYAFPIQQLLSYLWGDWLNVPSFFVLSTSITLITAIISWHFIEKRAMKLKNISFRRNKNQILEKSV
ncbi:acyltransferase [Paenibacillus sp. ISL-20]|uniref:acyltransferase family protein n=1 Tax=Paenibacillus sp. ISL-20 TaxID=2819163 RepID=UPI001BE616E5|nr:acyltransferase [Paenibacillus sp. ISL-20]MBT2763309.1 acyltransferase [Paenibacillus sp. ISL-20]